MSALRRLGSEWRRRREPDAPAAAQQPAPAKPADKPAAPAAPAAKPAAPKPPAPPAAPKPGDAKALLTAADKKFKANDFAGALADYEASNAAKASPEAQRGIALSHDNLQHWQEKSVTVTPTPYVTSTGGGAGALIRF